MRYVYKTGEGYRGPGIEVQLFTGLDGIERSIVAHRIAGGLNDFYHIYMPKQLRELSKAEYFELLGVTFND